MNVYLMFLHCCMPESTAQTLPFLFSVTILFAQKYLSFISHTVNVFLVAEPKRFSAF